MNMNGVRLHTGIAFAFDRIPHVCRGREEGRDEVDSLPLGPPVLKRAYGCRFTIEGNSPFSFTAASN
jgi:hypothetical protein